MGFGESPRSVGRGALGAPILVDQCRLELRAHGCGDLGLHVCLVENDRLSDRVHIDLAILAASEMFLDGATELISRLLVEILCQLLQNVVTIH
jgi:hypothetical protein